MSQTSEYRAPDAAAPRKNLSANDRGLIANVRNDITIPYFTDVLSPQDETLIAKGGGKGLALYNEVERDPHAYAVLMKRKHELIARDWSIDPLSDAANDVAIADFLTETIEATSFDQHCLDALDATLKGFSVSEIVWGRKSRWIVPKTIVNHDQRRFTFDLEWKPRLLTREAMLNGIALPDRNFIVHRFGVKGNDPFGLGLGSRLFWAVLFKREGIAFWMTFLEKYASPTPVAKIPMGIAPSEENKLLGALTNMIQSGAITIPMGSELSYLEASRSAPASYEEWERYWDEQISECVLGETLSTNIGSVGSQAAATVHSEAKSQIIDADADLLSDTHQETLLRWLVEYNFPGSDVPRLRRHRPKNEKDEAESREAIAKADDAERGALEKALRFARDLDERDALQVMRDTSSLAGRMEDRTLKALLKRAPEPIVVAANPGEEGTPPKPGEPPASDDEESDPAAFKAFAAPGPEIFDTPFVADDVLNAVRGPLDAAMADWLIRLRGESDQIETIEDLRAFPDRLLDRAPPAALVEVIESSILFAAMVGRASVVVEAEEDGLSRGELFPDDPIAFSDIVFQGAPFDLAMKYLRAKTAIGTKSLAELERGAHDRAFAVGGETKADVVEDIRQMILESFGNADGEQATGLEGYRKAFRKLLASGKWSGDKRLAKEEDRFAWRTEITWQTNMATAHAAGRREQQKALTHVLPFWQYRHGATRTPKRPRVRHLRLDGLTLPADDPVWDRIYAPNGWRCSCAIRAITRTAADRVDKNNREAPTEDEIGAAIDHDWQHAPGLEATPGFNVTDEG